MITQKPEQLFTLINQFSLVIKNKDELGSLVGFVIMATLVDFIPQAGSWSEIQLEEISALYQGLEDALEQCQNSDSFQILCNYNVKVHEFIKEYDDDEDKLKNPLIKRIMALLKQKRGVPADTLRRNGLALADAVIERGPLTRKIDCLKQDYRLLETIFAS